MSKASRRKTQRVSQKQTYTSKREKYGKPQDEIDLVSDDEDEKKSTESAPNVHVKAKSKNNWDTCKASS